MSRRLPAVARFAFARRPQGLLATAAMLALGTLGLAAQADEGMWTFDNPPLAKLQQEHKVALSAQWLQRLRLASVNFGGASAAFVSANGLVLTNHHVARGCVARLSSAEHDYDGKGFLARTQAEELRCPGTTVRVLQSTDDVTAQVRLATAGALDDAARNASRKRALGQIERDCQQATKLRCEVVALYGGAVYQLYRYKQWDDVRLAFAPDAQAAVFGGDFDNFVYPRFALDFALARVYENGKPVKPASYLRVAKKPVAEGDLIFISGHPGSTARLQTVTRLSFERDVELPRKQQDAQAHLKLLKDYARRSPEAARQVADEIFGTENRLKVVTGELETLQSPEVMAVKAGEEKALRDAFARRALQGDPWGLADAAVARHRERFEAMQALDLGRRGLLNTASDLVALAEERTLPEQERLAAWRDSEIPKAENRLRARVPVYKELEVLRLAAQLTALRRGLGETHPAVKAALGNDTPEVAAERLVRGTRLDDPAVREALIKGGRVALAASDDALIGLARQMAPVRHELARVREEQIDTPLEKAAEQIGQARYALQGTSVPPDATGTLRLSYGRVAGYMDHGISMPWKTTWGGLLARADSFDNKPPFNLSAPIAAVRDKLNTRAPLNFVSTGDTIGGNSGSPVVNVRGELVGLLFDGNLASLAGRYLYRDDPDRSLQVDVQAILQALEQVYGAPQLAKELKGG